MSHEQYLQHINMTLHAYAPRVTPAGSYTPPFIYARRATLNQSLVGAGQLEPPTEVVTLNEDEVSAPDNESTMMTHHLRS
jgi:hypothetical protein